MATNNSTLNSRFVFENAKQVLQANGVSTADAILTQSDLVLEQTLVTTKTNYQFGVLDNNNGPSGTQFPTEVRLTQQDSFLASMMGFYLILPASLTAGNLICHTYPNPVVFTTGASALETLYNSILKIQVNNRTIVPVWYLGRHRMVPQSQQATAAANQNGIALDQIDMSSDGIQIMEPNIVIIGSKGTVITVNLPTALATVDANTRMRLWFRGVLAQNSTIIT